MAVSSLSVARISIDQQCQPPAPKSTLTKTPSRKIPITNPSTWWIYPWTFKDCVRLFEQGMWTDLIIVWIPVSKASGQISASDVFMTCRGLYRPQENCHIQLSVLYYSLNFRVPQGDSRQEIDLNFSQIYQLRGVKMECRGCPES